MFMIHVLFINIALPVFACFMSAYSKEVDMGKNCMYPRVLSVRPGKKLQILNLAKKGKMVIFSEWDILKLIIFLDLG